MIRVIIYAITLILPLLAAKADECDFPPHLLKSNETEKRVVDQYLLDEGCEKVGGGIPEFFEFSGGECKKTEGRTRDEKEATRNLFFQYLATPQSLAISSCASGACRIKRAGADELSVLHFISTACSGGADSRNSRRVDFPPFVKSMVGTNGEASVTIPLGNSTDQPITIQRLSVGELRNIKARHTNLSPRNFDNWNWEPLRILPHHRVDLEVRYKTEACVLDHQTVRYHIPGDAAPKTSKLIPVLAPSCTALSCIDQPELGGSTHGTVEAECERGSSIRNGGKQQSVLWNTPVRSGEHCYLIGDSGDDVSTDAIAQLNYTCRMSPTKVYNFGYKFNAKVLGGWQAECRRDDWCYSWAKGTGQGEATIPMTAWTKGKCLHVLSNTDQKRSLWFQPPSGEAIFPVTGQVIPLGNGSNPWHASFKVNEDVHVSGPHERLPDYQSPAIVDFEVISCPR